MIGVRTARRLAGPLVAVAAVAVAITAGSALAAGPTGASAKGMPGMEARMQAASRKAAASAPTRGSTITIHNFAFSPGSLKVRPGQKVTVVNRDSVTHTVTSTTGKFNTGDIGPGKTVTFIAPRKAGKYPYRCTIHQYMTGTLVVS